MSDEEVAKKKSSILRILIPVAVIVAGGLVAASLAMTRPEAKKIEQVDRGRLVDVDEVAAGAHEIEVRAEGKVIPAQQVTLNAEVGGRVTWQSKELVPGGIIDAGDTLVRIDPRDYRLAVQQQQAAVDKAKLELEVERSRKKVAEREWELLGSDLPEGDQSDSLALREPQLRTARVAVESAESGLERARLNVERTTVDAPFNALVQQEQVDVGQLVGPQQPLATLVGTDQFWVQVSVPVDQLRWIRVPGMNAREGEGSPVRVWQELDGYRLERAGRVVRMLGELDPTGGLARVLVAVDDPFGLRSEAEQMPLLIGAFVHVAIDAGELDGVVSIPRSALREGDKVYVMSDDGRLEVRDVQIAWRYPDRVLVREGLRSGEALITSRVGDAVPGMKVRRPDQGAEPSAAAARPEAKLESELQR